MQAEIFVAVGGFNEEGFATTAVGQNRRRDRRRDANGSWFEHNSHAPQSLSTCERPKDKHTVPLTSVPTWKRVKQGPSQGPHVQQFVHGSNAVRKLNQTFYPTKHHTILPHKSPLNVYDWANVLEKSHESFWCLSPCSVFFFGITRILRSQYAQHPGSSVSTRSCPL